MSVDGQPHFFHPQALKIDQISNNARRSAMENGWAQTFSGIPYSVQLILIEDLAMKGSQENACLWTCWITKKSNEWKYAVFVKCTVCT